MFFLGGICLSPKPKWLTCLWGNKSRPEKKSCTALLKDHQSVTNCKPYLNSDDYFNILGLISSNNAKIVSRALFDKRMALVGNVTSLLIWRLVKQHVSPATSDQDHSKHLSGVTPEGGVRVNTVQQAVRQTTCDWRIAIRRIMRVAALTTRLRWPNQTPTQHRRIVSFLYNNNYRST